MQLRLTLLGGKSKTKGGGIDMRKDSVTQVVESYLQSIGRSYFWGGSRRLGIEIVSSDYDIFILGGKTTTPESDGFIPPPEVQTHLGLCWEQDEEGLSYPKFSYHFKTVIFSKKVDVLFIPEEKIFGALSSQHSLVEAFLNGNSDLKESLVYCRSLEGYRGGDLWRFLLSLATDRIQSRVEENS